MTTVFVAFVCFVVAFSTRAAARVERPEHPGAVEPRAAIPALTGGSIVGVAFKHRGLVEHGAGLG